MPSREVSAEATGFCSASETQPEGQALTATVGKMPGDRLQADRFLGANRRKPEGLGSSAAIWKIPCGNPLAMRGVSQSDWNAEE